MSYFAGLDPLPLAIVASWITQYFLFGNAAHLLEFMTTECEHHLHVHAFGSLVDTDIFKGRVVHQSFLSPNLISRTVTSSLEVVRTSCVLSDNAHLLLHIASSP